MEISSFLTRLSRAAVELDGTLLSGLMTGTVKLADDARSLRGELPGEQRGEPRAERGDVSAGRCIGAVRVRTKLPCPGDIGPKPVRTEPARSACPTPCPATGSPRLLGARVVVMGASWRVVSDAPPVRPGCVALTVRCGLL